MFWPGFYGASEDLLFPQSRKHYFVFTDSKRILHTKAANVTTVLQKRLGWPYDTLMRFGMFEQVLGDLKSSDFALFINSNMVPVARVDEGILPGPGNDDLFVVLHPGYFAEKDPNVLNYERNSHSCAYIPYGQGKHYFMGGFNGGRTGAYSEMIAELSRAVREDLSKGIVALWHDESHLNKYMLHRSPKILDPSYGYPEGLDLPFEPRIVIQNKNGFGGHAYLRGELPFRENSFAGKVQKRVSAAYRRILRGRTK